MPKHFLYNLAIMAAADVVPQAAQSQQLFARAIRRLNRSVHDLGVMLASTHGGAFYQNTPDRLVLENTIVPFYQLSGDHRAIFFVGCDWYTAGYARRFSLKNYATIDPDANRAKFGAANHQIAPMRNLGAAHAPNSLDLIVCNGVIGWGLDDIAEAETSFDAAFAALRPGGHLIVGWNDLPRHLPFAIDSVEALGKFNSLVFPPLSAAQFRVDHALRHIFNFYVKPA